MKFLTRVLLFLALTGAGSFLLAELVNPLRGTEAAKAAPLPEAPDIRPEALAKAMEQDSPQVEAVPEVAPQATVEKGASEVAYTPDGRDGKEALDGKQVLDAKDYKEAIGEGPGRAAGPGSLAPGSVPRVARGPRFVPPPDLPPDTVPATPN